MQKLTHKNLYLAIAAGLSIISSSPAFSTIVNVDDDGDGNDDGIVVTGDTNGTVIDISPEFFGGVFVGDAAGNHSVLLRPETVSGSHAGVASQHTWRFDENGFISTIDDTPAGGSNTNSRNDTATFSSHAINNGTGGITSSFQNAALQHDEASDGTSTASRDQTATSQDNQIIAGGNSNKQNSTVAGTTRTVVGAGGTTTTMQDDRDFIASTGAGAGSATMGIKRSGGAGNTTAEVLVTNSAGNTHGLVVGENKTTLSGGTNSTTITLDDNGATFAGAGGAPARVAGVADGVNDFDAVNMRQLNNLDKKLNKKIDETGAISAAFAQLGHSQTPGKSSFGIAAGGQGGKGGIALGFSHRPVTMKPVVVKASLGAAGKTVAGGIGATWEF